MNFREFLKSLGLEDSVIDQIMKDGINKNFIPKHRFDEVNEELKAQKDLVGERDKQIKDLSKFEGDVKDLKTKIEELETANKTKDEEYQTNLKAVKLENAIKNALKDQVQEGYIDIVEGLLDKSILTLKDDGSVAGLQEQIDSKKADKPLLFAEAKKDADSKEKDPVNFKFKGDDPKDSSNNEKTTDSEAFVNDLLANRSPQTEASEKAATHYFN